MFFTKLIYNIIIIYNIINKNELQFVQQIINDGYHKI
jgi:hypothetical protein